MNRLVMLLVVIGNLSCAHASFGQFPAPFNTEPEADETRMSPSDAAESMVLPTGFRARAFAAEPDVQNPIAMAWDSRGRLWIAENYTYAERDQRFQLDLRDRVLIFDGTEGDRFSKRTVFTDNVTMLTGLEVGLDGVWLMCPPKLIFIPDRDHDDVPDDAGHVVLDGFTVAQQNYHNFANGLRFGPDGWLYGRCGGSCPGRIGRPGTPDHRRLALEGGIWRYHPQTQRLEVLTSGTTNPWGHDWNDRGEGFFINTVNGHLWHLIPGAHFTRPFLLDPNRRTYELIDFHADHWHFDTGSSWTDSRDGAANAFGGGHAHSGMMIYQGGRWPSQYAGKLYTWNLHGRRANQERLEREGSGYVGRHDDDFMIAKDDWCRGMDLSSGPRGDVFVIDWSDAGECHEHTGVHRTSGRIYKIIYDQADPALPTVADSVDVRQWSESDLAAAHAESNQWYVRQARLELIRRRDRGRSIDRAADALRAMVQRANHPSAVRVQCLLTAHAIKPDREWLQQHLNDRDPHVRVWAIRLLSEGWTLDDALGPAWVDEEPAESIQRQATALLPRLIEMAQADPEPLVRLTLASTLQRLPTRLRPELAVALVQHTEDAEDHNLPLMIWYGLIPVAEVDCQALVPVARACRLPTTLRLIARCLAEEIENDPEAFNQLLELVPQRDRPSDQAEILRGVSQGLKGWRRAPRPRAWSKIETLKVPALSEAIRELSVVFGDGRAMDQLRDVVTDADGVDVSVRVSALETLIEQQPPDLRAICEALLDDAKLRVTAAQGLARFDDPKIADALVKRYRRFRAPFRPQIMSILVSRPSFARKVLDAIGRGDIPRHDLSAYQVRQIHSFEDPDLDQLVREVWGQVRQSSEEKQQAIEGWKQRLNPTVLADADLRAGRVLFQKTCQSCHRLYGQGEKIGPDLTGSDRSNLDYLLSNIVDPSRVVDKDYWMTILVTDDNRLISGLIIDQTPKTVTVQTATERMVLSQDQIVSRKRTNLSPMPDGLIDALSEDQVRDLIAYLQHPTQVPLPDTAAASDVED